MSGPAVLLCAFLGAGLVLIPWFLFQRWFVIVRSSTYWKLKDDESRYRHAYLFMRDTEPIMQSVEALRLRP